MYYKILFRDGNKLRSMLKDNPFAITYRVGVWVTGVENTGLFIFDSLYFAELFKDFNEEIWTVEAENTRKVELVLDPFLLHSCTDEKYLLELIKNYWFNNSVPRHNLDYTFSGTLVCDRLKLIERVI